VGEVRLVEVAGCGCQLGQAQWPLVRAGKLESAPQPEDPSQHRSPVAERRHAATVDLALREAGGTGQAEHRGRAGLVQSGRDLEGDIVDRSCACSEATHGALQLLCPPTVVGVGSDALGQLACVAIPQSKIGRGTALEQPLVHDQPRHRHSPPRSRTPSSP